MAFADPQSVTINAVAQSMPRIASGVNTGAFQTNDSFVSLSVSHQYGKDRTRRQIRLNQDKITTNLYTPSINSRYSMSVYSVVDIPNAGFSIAEQKFLTDAFFAYLTASSGAKVTQLLGGEN